MSLQQMSDRPATAGCIRVLIFDVILYKHDAYEATEQQETPVRLWGVIHRLMYK